MVGVNYSARPEYFELLPIAALLQNNETDEELASLATNFLIVLAQTMTLAEYIPQALEAIKKVARCSSWLSRAVLADFLPVFVFYNMATINAEKVWNKEVSFRWETTKAQKCLFLLEKLAFNIIFGKILGKSNFYFRYKRQFCLC